jgi:hypothetical protein
MVSYPPGGAVRPGDRSRPNYGTGSVRTRRREGRRMWKAVLSTSWMVNGPRKMSVKCTVRRRSAVSVERGVRANDG